MWQWGHEIIDWQGTMLSFSYMWTAEPLLKAGSLIKHLPAPGTAWDAADSIFIRKNIRNIQKISEIFQKYQNFFFLAEINWGICSSPRHLLHAAGKTGSTQHSQKTKEMLCWEEIRTEIAPWWWPRSHHQVNSAGKRQLLLISLYWDRQRWDSGGN